MSDTLIAASVAGVIAVAGAVVGAFIDLYRRLFQVATQAKEGLGAMVELKRDFDQERRAASQERVRIADQMGKMATREDVERMGDRLTNQIDRMLGNGSNRLRRHEEDRDR